MENVQFIRHSTIDPDVLKNVCEIKQIAWQYGLEKQIEWINQNIRGEDFHVLMYGNTNVIAYLNLININVCVDGNNMCGFGVGNVCSRTRGIGYGGMLMKKVNNFLTTQEKLGLLFCKPSLVKFYSKYHWKQIDKKNLCLGFDNNNIETMYFGFLSDFSSLSFLGSVF